MPVEEVITDGVEGVLVPMQDPSAGTKDYVVGFTRAEGCFGSAARAFPEWDQI